MNIRSLTTGAALPSQEAARAAFVTRLGEFARVGRAALEAAGFTVQTTRLSTQPLDLWLAPDSGAMDAVRTLGEQCAQQGIDYCSLGTIQAQDEDNLEVKRALWELQAEFVAGTENIFASLQVGSSEAKRINLEAVRSAAATIKELSTSTPDGFGNLRFAAAASCPPHVPFFPASYYAEDVENKGAPEFGLALEAADLAVQAFSGASSPEEARANLLALLTDHCDRLAQVCGTVGPRHLDCPLSRREPQHRGRAGVAKRRAGGRTRHARCHDLLYGPSERSAQPAAHGRLFGRNAPRA
jgi:uncharacterized protein